MPNAAESAGAIRRATQRTEKVLEAIETLGGTRHMNDEQWAACRLAISRHAEMKLVNTPPRGAFTLESVES